MNPTVDNALIKAFGNPPERLLNSITEIVVHHTEGETGWESLKSWMTSNSCENKNLYEEFVGLFHYCIEKTGEVYQTIPLESYVFHSCCGQHDKVTIGIELVQKDSPFTDAQYASLADLVEQIYQICPIKTLVSHDYNYMMYSNRSKGCPGRMFDWKNFMGILAGKGITPIVNLYNGQ